ncbi:MAG: hypothetical protein ABI885_29890 [Gammaproteobacteria bacterium]
MPVRSFKVDIANQSSYLTLRKRDENACSGGWTDGWGSPPASIPPGASIGFQGESDNIFGGTEAWVKYDAIDNGGNRHGELYVYWDNPYYGATHWKAAVVHGDVTADCNAGPSEFDTNDSEIPDFGGSSSFSDLDGGTGIQPALNGTLANALLTTSGGILTGIPALLGTQHIVAHAHLSVSIQDVAKPGYSATSYTYTPLANPRVTDWIGHWSAQNVDIQIIKKSGDVVTITIHDNGSTPPLSMTVDIDVGQHTIKQLIASTAKPLGEVPLKLDPVQQQAVTATVNRVLSLGSLPQSRADIQVHLNNTISAAPELEKESIAPAVVQHISRNLAVPLAAKGTLRLDNGVGLTLMQTAVNGAPQAVSVHFQRFAAGIPSRDVEIGRYSPPPR